MQKRHLKVMQSNYYPGRYDLDFYFYRNNCNPTNLKLDEDRIKVEGLTMPDVVARVYQTLGAPGIDSGEPINCTLEASDELIQIFNDALIAQNNNNASKIKFIGLQGLFNDEFLKKHRQFEDQLALVADKVQNLHERGYEVLARKMNGFHDWVLEAAKAYFINPTVENYNRFKNSVDNAYIAKILLNAEDVIDPETDFQMHRDCKYILGNILLAILGLGVFYGIAVYLNGGLFFQKTDSLEKIDALFTASHNLTI